MSISGNAKVSRLPLTAKFALLFTVTLLVNVISINVQGADTWSATGSMATPRRYHTATPLINGKILVTGGLYDSSGYSVVSSCELYDPATGVWSSTGSMAAPKAYHTATLLSNGKVLVAGGQSELYSVLASCELYDPDTGTWSSTGVMSKQRSNHTATLFSNGKVLVAGGYGDSNYLSSCELYDPVAGTWSATGAMSAPRAYHTATLLFNNKVLIAGGYNYDGTSHYLSACELYDTNAGTWSTTGSMSIPRQNDTATLLSNGKVLVVGGYDGNSFLSSCELYDPVPGTWSSTVPMVAMRGFHTATLLQNGKVLVAGWASDSTCELYDPTIGAWSSTGSTVEARQNHTATLLLNGKVLAAGGVLENTCELYTPGSSDSYTISGKVALASTGAALAGVSVSGGLASATSGSDGTYTISGLANGSYTITPTLSGYTFTPATSSVTISGTSQTGVDFTASGSTGTYTISGKVTLASTGAGLAGVTVSSGASGSATTGTDGTYTVSGLANGSYTVTPSLSGNSFNPTSRSVTISSANQTGIDFSASAGGGSGEWSALGAGVGGASPKVYAIAQDKDGNIYAGGRFTMAGGAPANYVAKWDGNTWSALGDGLGGTDQPWIYALACDTSGNLYAGGNFTTAGGTPVNGGIPVNYVAKWDGKSWSALGTGFADGATTCVFSLACDSSGNLYAGGNFNTAGGVACKYIAKWNGNSWSALGTGLDATVDALTLDADGNLYAGGFFIKAGGNDAKGVAKWDGEAWSGLGSGFDYQHVNALACDKSGNLYAAGYFTKAGGVSVNNIAKWNGSAWSALGAGSAVTVWALACDTSGNLYAGGSYTTGDGTPANNIAKWNGSAWSALGSGLDKETVALLTDPSDNLYAGGFFSTAGGVSAIGIAKWSSGSAGSYSISGKVTLASTGAALSGVAVSAGTASATTGTDGTYTVSGLANGSYTVMPFLSGYSFNPTSRSITISSANQTGIDFSASPGGGSNGSLWATGTGMLGDGPYANRNSPVLIISSGVQAVSTGNCHTMILKTDGSLWACGQNSYGGLGDGTTTDREIPVQIFSGGIRSVSVYDSHSMIVKSNGSLWACGRNNYGQIGDGTTIDRSTPVQIFSSGVQAVSAGVYHSMILKTDGSLWACGFNGSGELGDGTTIDRSTPVQIFSSGVQAVAASNGFTMILKTDGSLWACGWNQYGQLGNGSNTYTIPLEQILASGVKAISAGASHTMILKTDGSLWTSGRNKYGQLGDGTTTDSNTYKQILPSGIQMFSGGDYHSAILKTDGSLWMCGGNEYGELGDGTNIARWTPVQIFPSGIQAVSAGAVCTFILKDPIASNYTVAFTAGIGGTISGTNPQTVDPGGSCTAVTAVPDSGYGFTGWTGDVTSSDNPLTVKNVTNNMTVTANFIQVQTVQLSVAVTPQDGGTTNPSGTSTVDTLKAIKILATANAGYRFLHWAASANATLADANSAGTTVTLIGDATVTASFAQVQATAQLSMAVSPQGGGTTDPSAPKTVNTQELISISATANGGYNFLNWTAEGNASVASPNSMATTVTLFGNATVTANFATVQATADLTVQVSPAGSGSATPFGTSSVSTGQPQNITATAEDGYYFVVWSADNAGASFADASNPITTVTIANDTTITANFAEIPDSTDVSYGKVYACQGASDFTKAPKVHAIYTDPVSGKTGKKVSLKVLNKIKEPTTIAFCEWKGRIMLFNKKLWDKTATCEDNLLNPDTAIEPLETNLFVNGEDAQVILYLVPPEITGVYDSKGNEIFSAKAGDAVTVKGTFFGKSPPILWLEYPTYEDKNETVVKEIKALRLKTSKVLEYSDFYNKAGKSCMDIETGLSEITVYVPTKFPKGWDYLEYHNIVIDNKVGRATIQFQTEE